MTAEVGIMNRTGIALAADSAVTVGSDARKVYASADKLFQLVDDAPVGIMFFGGASVLGVPWETVVKQYRSERKARRFRQLGDYAAEFLAFLKAHRGLFPDPVQRQFVASTAGSFLSLLLGRLYRRLDEEGRKGGQLSEPRVQSVFSIIVAEELMITRESPVLAGLPNGFAGRLRRRYGNLLKSTQRKVLEKLPLTAAVDRTLTVLLSELFVHARLFAGAGSGMVIAGFGDHEYFPGVVAFSIGGVAGDELLYGKEREEHVGEVEACVMPFAQSEMVHTFMQGMDPALHDFFRQSTDRLLRHVAEEILADVKQHSSAYGTQLEARIQRALPGLLAELASRWEDAQGAFSAPVMEMVASLPKDELAAMAESLVNLTKFKRRVSKQPETVGGPIDVAVITKGDGFVWVRRKHYFRPELNPRFMARYYRSEN